MGTQRQTAERVDVLRRNPPLLAVRVDVAPVLREAGAARLANGEALP